MINDFAGSHFTNNYDPDFHRVFDMLGELALKNYKKKNTPKLQKRYTEWLASYYSKLGTRYSQKEQYDKSVLYFDKAIALYKATKSYDNMYVVGLTKSQTYVLTKELNKAIPLIFSALKYYEKDKKTYVHSLPHAYTMLANIYRHQNEFEKSIQYSQEGVRYYDLSYKAYPMNRTLNYKASAYQNIAYCNSQLKKYREALAYCEKSLEITKKLGANVQTSLALTAAADMQMKLSNFTEAEKLYQEVLELKSATTNSMTMATTYFGLGTLNFNKGDLANAGVYQEKAFELSKKTGNKILQKDIAEMLYKINLANKNYEKALQYYEFDKKLADSTRVASSKREMSEQQLKYEFEKKELQQKIIQQKKLAAIKLESERKTALETSKNKLAQQQLKYDFERKELQQKIIQGKKVSAVKLLGEKKAAAIKLEGEKKTAIKNNWLIGLSSLLLLIVVGAYFYYRNSKQKQAITVLEKNQIKQKLLITQMNPHFIFNSVQNIRSLINNKQNDEAVNYLGKFSKLTRQILENSNENYISLEEEVEMIENYLSIQQLLYDNKFKFTIDIQEGIDKETIFLPPMLAQPFIENAIKHGLSNVLENGKIAIHFYLKENKLYFEVTDNGKGFGTDTQVSNHKSLAMTITKERLVTYTKNKDFVVQTDNLITPEGTVKGAKVVFEIPYIYEN
ncbi:tetratricopeptide repeat protein [Flavobacterium enshiense]|uniref:tetratricopeptide repeat-containing sensor histidine kinase n=1 Tax=Flavobacterium enshiense TaxID=1341165 RepID=UPI00345C7587